MKKKISALLALLLTLSIFVSMSVSANAALFDITKSGTIECFDGTAVKWSYTYNTIKLTGVLTLTGDGEIPNSVYPWQEYELLCPITSLTIGEGITGIGEGAFANETYIKNVNLPSTIKYIGRFAFALTALEYVTLPKSLESIDATAFMTPYFKNYYVATENKNYAVKDGVLYSKDMTTLVAYPIGRTYDLKNECPVDVDFTVPKTIKTIDKFAFYNAAFTSFTIPSTVKNVNSQSFANCGLLSDLTIENGVEHIYDSAFLGCSSLKSVFVPASVTDLHNYWYVFFYEEKYDIDGIKFELQNAGVSPGKYSDISQENAADYVNRYLTNFTSDQFKAYILEENRTIYAPSGSSAELYAKYDSCYFDGKNITVDFVATPIAMPKLLSVSNVYGGVEIKWRKISDASSYKIYRKTSDGYTELASVDGKTSYIDTSAESGEKYTYTVSAVTSAGEEGLKNEKGISVLCLSTPEIKKVSNAKTGITVKWAKTVGAEGYSVYRKSGSGSFKKIADVEGVSSVSYTDKSVKSGSKYTYYVKACNGKTKSGYKATSEHLYLATPTVKTSNSKTGINVKWNKITGAKGYYVYRKTGSGKWTKVKTVTSGSTVSYTDTTAKSGTKYSYYVKAYNGKTVSSYKASKTLMYLKAVKLSSASSGKTGITVKWGKVTSAKGYYVYRKTGSGSYKKIATVKSGSTVKYLDKSAKKGTTYTYYVKAYNGSFKGSYANTLKCKDKY